MKHLTEKIKIGFTVLAISLLATGCVSGPDEKQAEAIETANNTLSTGVSYYNNSKHELAISYFKNALRDFRSIDHQYGIASSCLNLSKTYLSIGNTDTAEAYLIHAQRIIKREKIKKFDNHLHIIESSIAIENKQLDRAKEILQPLLSNNDNNDFTLAATQNRTRIAFAESTDINMDDAKQWLDKFEQQIKSTRNPSRQARLARFKAFLSKDTSTQEKHLSTALNIYRKQTNRPGIAATLQEWGNVLIQHKKIEAAKDKLQRAIFIRQTLQDRKNSLKILNSLTMISDDSKTQLWLKKLENNDFKQWAEFIAAFNQFPE